MIFSTCGLLPMRPFPLLLLLMCSLRPLCADAGIPPVTVDGKVPTLAPLLEQVTPAVVNIAVLSRSPEQDNPMLRDPFFRRFFGLPEQARPQISAGSGVIVDARGGYVLTNHHVVKDAEQIAVTLKDGRRLQGKLVGSDAATDVALLKVEGENLKALTLGDSDALRVGDYVMAIGNPFGLGQTVTSGIVSALGRTGLHIEGYEDFIQTDASINPGNSGGPLFNERGEVVGINSAIFSQSGGNIGIGFAIPINLAKKLVPELEEHGSITRGWLGVSIQKVTPELASSLGLADSRGALVAEVTGESPAAKSGMERGDVIVGFNGKKVEESSALPRLVAETAVGKTVPVEVVRNGKTKTLEVTIARMTEETAQAENSPEAAQKSKWGLALRELRPEERAELKLKDGEGVMITGVLPDSPAAEASLQPGDVIVEVNKVPVGSVAALKKEAGKVEGDKPLLLLLRRENSNRYASLAAK